MAVETAIHPPRTMLEVFESLPEGTHVQLIENTLVMSPSPIDRHAILVLDFGSELNFLMKRKKHGTVRVAPYDVYLDTKNVFQPDVCVILNDRIPLIRRNGLYGAPNFVIEILSPSTAKYDLNEKKAAYERFGVTEYWTVDPEENIATGFYLIKDEYHQFFQEKGILKSRLLDITIEF